MQGLDRDVEVPVFLPQPRQRGFELPPLFWGHSVLVPVRKRSAEPIREPVRMIPETILRCEPAAPAACEFAAPQKRFAFALAGG